MRKGVQISIDAHRIARRLAAEHQPKMGIGQWVESLIWKESKRGGSRKNNDGVRPVLERAEGQAQVPSCVGEIGPEW